METKYLQLRNGKIAYDVRGSGPLVICVPSMGDLRDEYRFLVPQLVEDGYRVVTMDLRGHGESSVQWEDVSVSGIGSDLVALIQALGYGPAVIVGTSMAAGAAVWAAAEVPDSISGMVLIGPFVRGETSSSNRILYAALFARPWGPALWQKYYTSLYPTRKTDDMHAYTNRLRSNLQEPGRIEILKRMMMASKEASEARLPQVKAPVLVLMGSKDPDFKDPQAEASWVADNLGGTYQMVPDAGHYPHAEMPEIVGPHILSFLKAHQPVEAAAYGA
jgi:pimeloyl-ACP methyl ester carboxylesterase